ncbi:MAG: YqaA family protein [Caulobacterales bacterium]
MLRSLYARGMALAAGPRAEPALALGAFAESAFFPLAPDLMLGPMAAARPHLAARFAMICTAASVLGGLFGYAIGYFLAESVGRWLIALYGYGGQLEAFRAAYAQWGAWIILLKGLTPIPFKLVPIASGMAAFSLPMFVACCLAARGARFALVAWRFARFGPQIAPVIERRIGLVMAVIAAAIVLGVVAMAVLH